MTTLSPGPGPTAGSPATTVATTSATGPCVDSDLGDSFWVGGTFATKLATVSLDGTVVYGRRALFSAAGNRNIEESGWGAQLTARVPIGPVQTWWHGWYTTGDENRIVGGSFTATPSAFRTPQAGQDFSQISNTSKLNRDSDKLPIPIANTSWGGAPFQAEWLLGTRTLGAPALGQALYLDATGTWGVGASGIFALTPAFSLGTGAAFVAATEDNGVFGDNVIEIDVGALYAYNPLLTFQFVAGYLIPDRGDNAWAVGVRTRFAF